MADEALARIDEEVKKNKVLIFMKGNPKFPQCGFSDATIRIFESFDYPFETVDVLADPQIRAGVKSYSNWPTIPQVFVDGKFIGGCDIIREMHERGELAQVLKSAFEK
jgi:monothiol glutaredoxin